MKFNAKQEEAQALLAGNQTHTLLFGGSRSGKTVLLVRAIVMRALKAAASRHAIMRFRFNHVVESIAFITLPWVMEHCFPQVDYSLDKQHWFARIQNDSEVWLGGLDDKERTEKVLGKEYATILLNECSQIPWNSRNVAVTRLAQQCTQRVRGRPDRPLKPRMYYDCNPPNKGHWAYRLFLCKEDPITAHPLPYPDDFAWYGPINPVDNRDNLPEDYVRTLESLPARERKRFLEGQFAEANPNALWTEDILERWRVREGQLPDLQRIVIGVDPSGSGEDDAADHDEIGIVVAALGTDGVGYVLEDCSLKAGPGRWGSVAVATFERHAADLVVGEVNYGGAMVQHVIQTAQTQGKRKPPFKAVTASRGKVVRAEPISALFEKGQARLVGEFHQLEQEMLSFATTGYMGQGSPNRADAMIWALSELFPGMVKQASRSVGRAEYAVM